MGDKESREHNIDKNFDRAWKMFTEFGNYELHFNELQSKYRTLAFHVVADRYLPVK